MVFSYLDDVLLGIKVSGLTRLFLLFFVHFTIKSERQPIDCLVVTILLSGFRSKVPRIQKLQRHVITKLNYLTSERCPLYADLNTDVPHDTHVVS